MNVKKDSNVNVKGLNALTRQFLKTISLDDFPKASTTKCTILKRKDSSSMNMLLLKEHFCKGILSIFYKYNPYKTRKKQSKISCNISCNRFYFTKLS